MGRRAALILALACGSVLARPQDAGAEPPKALDVHGLELVTEASDLVPSVRIVSSERLSLDAPDDRREVSLRFGTARLGVQVERHRDGVISLLHTPGFMASSSPVSGATLDVTEPFRWSRRPRHGARVRGALLTEPVTDPGTPFVPLDVRGFLRRVAEMLFEEERPHHGDVPDEFRAHWAGTRWKAALLLGSLPLREYLDPAQIDRILEAGTKLSKRLDEESLAYLRPLIALGDRSALEARAEALDRGGSDRGAESSPVPRVPRILEDSVLVAYASAADPETRGLAGWIALGTRSHGVFDRLADDVQAGRAILPGDAERRAALTEHLVTTRAWLSIEAPLIALAASAAAITAILLGLRAALRRMF